ncbi:MAG: 50S ribosomal protein L25/general stress protein Ctc [Gammaproteobacteria bacterium]|nr:50S ribosomal protein L25/general stress protein Ctc [Gammaproteobacteria bacterium]
MSVDFKLSASLRSERGKNASRRLRAAGAVPGVIYGGGEPPAAVTFDHDALMHNLENEAFYSHVLTVDVDGKPQKAILRELQRHPYKPTILHVDLLRVREDTQINVHVPLHFINEDTCHGVKLEGGTVSHNFVELEIACLPKDLPEFIEVDVQDLNLNESMHLSDIKVPEGITIVELAHGEGHDHAVVSVHAKRVAAVTEEEEEEEKESTSIQSDEDASAENDSS